MIKYISFPFLIVATCKYIKGMREQMELKEVGLCCECKLNPMLGPSAFTSYF